MKGPLLVYALLEAIKLSKQIIVLNLEQGRETLIPQELGQKHLPIHFQYYDCITEIVRSQISPEEKAMIFKVCTLEY